MSELLAAASAYFELGFNVVTVKGKQPLQQWQKWTSQRQTQEEFEGLNFKDANGVGIICGTRSRDDLYLAVIDFDVKNLLPEAIEKGKQVLKELPITATEQTPSGGQHLIFYVHQKPKTVKTFHNEAAIELLGEHCYCAMAPSQGYKRLNDNFPTVINDLESVFNQALGKVGVAQKKPVSHAPQGFKPIKEPRPCMVEALKRQLSGATGHLMRLAVAAEYRRLGYPNQQIVELFKSQNDFNFDVCLTQVESADPAKAASCETIAEYGFCLPDCKLKRESFDYFCDDKGQFIPAKLAEWIMGKYSLATMMDNEETYVYLDGFFQPQGNILIKKAAKEALEDEYRKNRALEVLDYIKVSTYTTRREEPPHLIPLENGVLDLSKEPFELKPHSPDYMFFNKLPVKYDPEAECPAIKKFLREITNSEEDVTLLEEVIGFCLYREYFVAKSLMLVGDGSNGKSTFLNLMKAFLGAVNVSGRSLQDLELHRFAKADLHTKLANIYADLPDKALQSTGTFKMLTGRDLIAAEKKFQRTFHFENYSKLMFSANKVPEAYDDTSAFFRRWIIIVFPKAFVGSDADPYILEKLTTEMELSGLLNLALKGLKKLLKTGLFSHSKTTEETKEDYIRKSSPIAAFVLDCLETDSDAFIEKKPLYTAFAEYCRTLKLPIVLQDTFFKNLPKYITVADYKPTVEGRRIHTFKGIRYGLNASSLSRVSRVFHTLIILGDQFKNNGYNVQKLSDASYIKIAIPLDRVDSLDSLGTTSHKLVPTCGGCDLFHKPSCVFPNMSFEKIPEDSNFALDCRAFTPKKEAFNG